VSDQRGQLTVAAVGIMMALLAGAVVLVHLAVIRVEGGHAQRAADLAAIAAARRLAADPAASQAQLRTVAAAVARSNGARVEWLRVQRRGQLPVAVELGVAMSVRGTLPAAATRSDRLPARARAGVSYSATLPERVFRPVDLHGATGRAAVVAAAEAQIGWPYVWGGESRAEGGFDCSGLVDYAYAQAGLSLPGRPTAAELWHLAQPIAEQALAPGDLVFMGAPSGAPYHVGLYAGDGLVVVAPHTGAQVMFQPLAGAGWDGFGRLLGDAPAPAAPTAVERAAHVHQVPAYVLQTELDMGLARDPERAAAVLQDALRHHPGDLMAALTAAVGDPSTAALVMRAASGPGLGSGFAAEVRLLPEPVSGATAAADAGPAAAAAGGLPEAAQPGNGGSSGGLAGSVAQAADSAVGGAGRIAGMAESEGRSTLGGLAGVRHLSRLALSALALFPDRTVSAAASAAGSVWDVAAGVAELINGGLEDGMVATGGALWASRLTAVGGLLSAITGGVLLMTGRTRRQRILGAAQAVGGAVQVAGFATAGTDLIVLGAAGMEVPPVGAALIVTGTVITCGVVLYQSWPALSAAGGSAARWAGGRIGRAAGRVRSAAGAAWDGARSLASALPTPW
jgi:cell wall-associated NlpC family hydrolase